MMNKTIREGALLMEPKKALFPFAALYNTLFSPVPLVTFVTTSTCR